MGKAPGACASAQRSGFRASVDGAGNMRDLGFLGAQVLSSRRPTAVTQEPCAYEADPHHDSGADEQGRLRAAMREAEPVDHRADCLAEIEEARVERGGG